MSEKIRELISEKDVAEKIAQMGAQISKDYEGESVYLLCILKGGVFFTTELAKQAYHGSGIDRFYVCFQLWRGDDIFRYRSYCQGSGYADRGKKCADRRGYYRHRAYTGLSDGAFKAAQAQVIKTVYAA